MHICHINLVKGFAGGERQTLNLIRELAAEGIRQTLVCHPMGQLREEVQALGVEVRLVSHWLKGHLRPSPGTLMHCHCGRSVHWAAVQHLLFNQPYLITRRVDNPIKTNRWTRYAYQNALKVVCLSRAIQQQVHCLKASIPTTLIPSSFSGFPADEDEVMRIRSEYPGKYLIGQAGKLLEHKGFKYTIEAARLLEERYPHAHFLLLGDGPKREEFEAQSRDLVNLTMLGHKTDIGNYLAALDLFLFPSLSEGLGSSILEAMQHGVPVLATRAGGIPDLIEDGVTGSLVAPGNAKALADEIAAFIDEPEKRRTLVKVATDRLSDFSPQAIASRYLSLYQSLSAKQEI